MEEIMENIAATLNINPQKVRMANMSSRDNPIPEMIATLKKVADYEDRRKYIEEFNIVSTYYKVILKIVIQ
jgi:xanthine dehydrogenase molybdopterin-binding subunit B